MFMKQKSSLTCDTTVIQLRLLENCLFSSSFLHHFFRHIGNSNGEFGAKHYFTDHWTANTIQLFVAIKGIFFLVCFFSGQVAVKRNSSETA